MSNYTLDDPFIPRLEEAPDRADRLLTRSTLAKLPPPKPLIDNVLDCGALAVLYGAWGLGKSFVAIDWAACVATGRPWQGRATEQAKVLYIAAEGAYGFDKRLSAWEHAWGYTIPDDHLHISPLPVDLMSGTHVTDVQRLVRRGGYSFVIVDTLARCIVGADENTSRDMGVAVDSLDRLRRAGSTVLVVHHPVKDGTTLRGSSALEGAADTVYAMIKDGAGFILDRKKRKDGPVVDRHKLKLTQVADSCIVEICRQAAPTEGLELIKAAFGTDGASKSQIRDALMAAGRGRSSAYGEIGALLKDGLLREADGLVYVSDAADDS